MRLVLQFTRAYLLRFWPWYLVGAVALVATTALQVTIPLYLADAIDALDRGPDGLQTVVNAAVIIAIMGAATMVVRTLSRVMFFTPGRLVEAEIKHDLMERVLRQQPSFLRQWSTGDLFSRASSDVNALRLLSGFGLLQVFNVISVLTLTLGQMARMSPWLTLWLVLPLGVGLVLTQVSIRWLFIIMRRMQEQIAELSDVALSSYESVATIQGFVAEEAFAARFDSINHAYRRSTVQRAGLRAVVGPILTVAAAACVFVILYIGGEMVIEGELSAGELVAFTTLVAQLAMPLRGLGFLLAIIKQAQASLERIDEVMSPEIDRPDLPNPAPAPTSAPALRFVDLTFTYPGSDAPVLNDVNIEVPAGGTLGLLGPTGAGKTTLLAVLSRLYNPPRGMVFVDGVDVLDLDLDGWRRVSILVPQRAHLFSESLRDNILLGAPDDGRLERALRLASLEQDIAALPDGAESQVGESGLMLSGGQRQRTALARGLIRSPHVLLLDDVLSAVDHATEAVLIDAMRPEGGVRPTTIIIANRISAIRHADTIAIIEGGRVTAQGTHDELRSQPGLYRETWLKQREGEAS